MASSQVTVENKRLWIKDMGGKGYQVHDVSKYTDRCILSSPDRLNLNSALNKIRALLKTK